LKRELEKAINIDQVKETGLKTPTHDCAAEPLQNLNQFLKEWEIQVMQHLTH
jgi:hypothetical protein